MNLTPEEADKIRKRVTESHRKSRTQRIDELDRDVHRLMREA